MEKEKLIQGYIKNSLSKDEQSEFERLLSSDEDFKTEFELYRDINSSITTVEANELKDHLKNFENLQNQKEDFSASTFKKWYPLVAAVLVIGFAITFYLNRSIDYYEEYFEVYPNVYQPIVRGDQNSQYYKAFQAYENQEFLEAISEFKLLEDLGENPNLQFYLAQSYLNVGKTDKAESILKKLRSIEFEFTSESKWYLVLVYLKQEKLLDAKTILEELEEEESDYKIDERTLILQKLNSP